MWEFHWSLPGQAPWRVAMIEKSSVDPTATFSFSEHLPGTIKNIENDWW